MWDFLEKIPFFHIRQSGIRIRKKMTDNNEQDDQRDADSKADAVAALGIILALVAIVVFWVSNQ